MAQKPDSRSSALEILELTDKAAKSPGDDTIFVNWHRAVQSADPATLVETTARLACTRSEASREKKALREGILAEIERKNADHIAKTMERLDASASRLANISLALTIVGVVLAGIQVYQAYVRN